MTSAALKKWLDLPESKSVGKKPGGEKVVEPGKGEVVGHTHAMVEIFDELGARSAEMTMSIISKGRAVATILLTISLAACSSPQPAHPSGELYLSPPSAPRVLPSTDNDPNGGAN